jgi:phenylacetate-CoA ligase
MGIADKIYNKLPLPLQNMAISVFGYFWQKRRFGGVFNEQLKEFKLREGCTNEQWKDYQNQQLTKLLLYAYDFVPLYTEKYSIAGFSREDLEKITVDTLY